MCFSLSVFTSEISLSFSGKKLSGSINGIETAYLPFSSSMDDENNSKTSPWVLKLWDDEFLRTFSMYQNFLTLLNKIWSTLECLNEWFDCLQGTDLTSQYTHWPIDLNSLVPIYESMLSLNWKPQVDSSTI